MAWEIDSRSPPLPLLPKTFNDPQHLLPPLRRIHRLTRYSHTDLLLGMRHQQFPQQQMPHLYAHEYSAITAVLLLRTIRKINELQLPTQQRPQLSRRHLRLPLIRGIERIVMESYAVEDTDKEEGPVGAPFGEGRVAAIVDREKNVGCAGEVWEGFFHGHRVGGLHKHEAH